MKKPRINAPFAMAMALGQFQLKLLTAKGIPRRIKSYHATHAMAKVSFGVSTIYSWVSSL